MLLLLSHPFLFHVHSSACLCLVHYQLLYLDFLLQFCFLVNFLSLFFLPFLSMYGKFLNVWPPSQIPLHRVFVFGLQGLSQSDLTGELPSLWFWGASLQLAVGWSKQLCFGHISIRFDLFFCWTKVYISERFYLPGHLVKLLHSVHRLVSPALHPKVFINWNFSSDSVCFGLVGTCLLNNQNNQLQAQCSFRPFESICIYIKSHSHR